MDNFLTDVDPNKRPRKHVHEVYLEENLKIDCILAFGSYKSDQEIFWFIFLLFIYRAHLNIVNYYTSAHLPIAGRLAHAVNMTIF